jgi:hypothetical protein
MGQNAEVQLLVPGVERVTQGGFGLGGRLPVGHRGTPLRRLLI